MAIRYNTYGAGFGKIIKLYKNGYFDKETIRQIGLTLLDSLEYIHNSNVLHLDIKPSNIVRGIYGNNTIININSLYFIDYGYSSFIGNSYLNNNSKSIFKGGTKEFMSINCHIHGIPSPNDDVESLTYTLLYMTNKGLPLLRLNYANKNYYKVTLEMKLKFDFIDYYNEEYSLVKFNPTHFNNNSYFFIQITKFKSFLSNIASKEELTPKNMSEIINKRTEDITKTINDEKGSQVLQK